MSNYTGEYDKELQMFKDRPRNPNFEQLEFLRWMAERGSFGHKPFSPPKGEFAVEKEAMALIGKLAERR